MQKNKITNIKIRTGSPRYNFQIKEKINLYYR